MLLNIDIAHQNDALTTRAEYRRSISIRDTVAIEIAELTDGDAPVAVSWADREGNMHHTRWYGGRHYRPYSGPIGPDDVVAALAELTATPGSIPDLTEGYFNPPVGNTYAFGDRRIVEYNAEARNLAVASAMEFGDDCIIVDGRVYLACGTPRFLLGYLRPEVSTEIPPVGSRVAGRKRKHDAKKDQWFHSHRYPLDDEAGARTALAVLFDIHGIREYVFPDVTIHIAESLHANDDYPRLREAAEFLMDNISYHRKFSRMPPPFLRAIAEVSEAAWEADGEPADSERLANALEAAAGDIAAVDPEGLAFLPQIVWRIREAARRHFDSEIGFEFTGAKRFVP